MKTMKEAEMKAKKTSLGVTLGKGGGAKTLIAGLLASTTALAGRSFALFDFDPSNPSLKTTFALEDRFVLNDASDLDAMFRAFDTMLTEAESKSVICDLGAGLDGVLFDFMEREGVLASFDQIHFNFLTPLTTIDSINNVIAATECKAQLPLIVVQNEFYRELEDAKDHPAWRELVDKDPAFKIVNLPDLGVTVREAKRLRMPLHKMAADKSNVSALYRSSAKRILASFKSAFASVEERMPWSC